MRNKTRRRLAIVVLALSLIPLGYALASRPAPPQNFDALRLALGQSPDFVAEYHNLATDMTDAGYWITRDYEGVAYHFHDGERLVVGACTTCRYTLWVFGNSGFQDPWLADADTAATKLQALIPAYRVVNRSAGGQHIAGQLAWLRETPVRAGDIVVFVDGAMDAPAGAKSVTAALVQAEAFTRARGAAWWHFRQPYIDAAYVVGMPGSPIDLGREYFIESAHMNERGAAIEARQIYDEISIY